MQPSSKLSPPGIRALCLLSRGDRGSALRVCLRIIKWRPRAPGQHRAPRGQRAPPPHRLLAAIPPPTAAQPRAGTHGALPAAPSAAGYHSEALRDAGHVVEHDAEEEDQDAGHQDDGAHAGPGGALGRAAPVRLLGRRLARGRGLQGLLLGRGDAHHGHRLRLGPGQQAAARVAGQQRALLGDGQGQHVAPVARQSDEDRRVLGGVGDGDDAQHLGVVRQLRHREARGQLGGAPAPGAAHVLLARPHLLQAHGAAGVPAVQQLGPPPGAVVVEADLALQQRVLRGRLHGERGRRAGPGRVSSRRESALSPPPPQALAAVARGRGAHGLPACSGVRISASVPEALSPPSA